MEAEAGDLAEALPVALEMAEEEREALPEEVEDEEEGAGTPPPPPEGAPVPPAVWLAPPLILRQ